MAVSRRHSKVYRVTVRVSIGNGDFSVSRPPIQEVNERAFKIITLFVIWTLTLHYQSKEHTQNPFTLSNRLRTCNPVMNCLGLVGGITAGQSSGSNLGRKLLGPKTLGTQAWILAMRPPFCPNLTRTKLT